MNFFEAIWIIKSGQKNKARPDQEIGRAIYHNRSGSRWRTDRSRSSPKKYVRQCGCLVWDHIAISFRLWKANNPSEQRDAVPEREKEWLWRELKKNFTVPAESEEAAKRCTLSKMAKQLQTFKKNLTKNYTKKGKTPSLLETLQSRRTTGMPLWHISL